MNREIKFRAWDRSLKKMIYPKLWDNSMPSNWERWYDLMQFTGLLDKNGREIYEGDIVVKDTYIWFDNGEPNYVGVVDFIFCQWQVYAHCINKSKHGISNGINMSLNDEGYGENEKSDWRIIGNIHENPELLTA